MRAPVRSTEITWLGHSTVLVDMDGVRVLTDPLARTRLAHLRRLGDAAPELPQPDAVVVSHVHHDHLDLPTLRRIDRATPVVVPRGAGRILSHEGFGDVHELAEGETVEIRGVAVQAVQAEHRASRPLRGGRIPSVGYMLDGSRRIYFAGDTDLFDGMHDLGDGLSVALLPIAGWGPRLPEGHLDPERAAHALKLLEPAVAIPIHWGTYWPFYLRRPASDEMVQEFQRQAALLAPEVEVRVLPVGASSQL